MVDTVLSGHASSVDPIVAQHFGGGRLTGLWGPPWGIAGMWLIESVALALAALLLVGFYFALPGLRRSRA